MFTLTVCFKKWFPLFLYLYVLPNYVLHIIYWLLGFRFKAKLNILSDIWLEQMIY